MPTPSAQLGLPQIAGTDSPDVPRDINAVISRFEGLYSVQSSRRVRDVGEVGQVRAGRPLTAADFTNMGLGAPAGLWNLSDLTDASGGARALTNKGAVPFGTGIMGAAGEAAVFAGSTAQVLYRVDAGGTDPFRITGGSFGFWARTAKRNVAQSVLSKQSATANAWLVEIGSGNFVNSYVSTDGTSLVGAAGVIDVADDRWHFIVTTYDGNRIRIYVDAVLDGQWIMVSPGPIFGGSGPLNIGGRMADAATATTGPMYGRVDAAFVTPDVLSEDQVRYLYCAALSHTAVAVGGSRLNVRRRKRGGPLVAAADFPATPVRLHNMNAATGPVTDEGSNGLTLSLNPNNVANFLQVAGPDGASLGAWALMGAHTGMSSSDTGLPSGTAARSYGIWMKASSGTPAGIMGWGTVSTGWVELRSTNSQGGPIVASSGADDIVGPGVYDGLWHHIVVTEDNAAADGVRRKLYVDGRLVGVSTVIGTIALLGANRFRIGAYPDGTSPFIGQLSRAFVYAGALTPEQVRVLYNVGSQQFPASPKSEGSHIEAVEAARMLLVCDGLEACDMIDLAMIA